MHKPVVLRQTILRNHFILQRLLKIMMCFFGSYSYDSFAMKEYSKEICLKCMQMHFILHYGPCNRPSGMNWLRFFSIKVVRTDWSVPPFWALDIPSATKFIWAASWQNQHTDMCAQRRLRSAWASAQSDQISLGIRPVWSESSLCAQWVSKDPRFYHADNENSDQTGRIPKLIWVFAGRRATLLVLSWGGSINVNDKRW